MRCVDSRCVIAVRSKIPVSSEFRNLASLCWHYGAFSDVELGVFVIACIINIGIQRKAEILGSCSIIAANRSGTM